MRPMSIRESQRQTSTTDDGLVGGVRGLDDRRGGPALKKGDQSGLHASRLDGAVGD